MTSISLFKANGIEARWNSTWPHFQVFEGERIRGSYRSEDAAVRAAKRFANFKGDRRDYRIAERLRNHAALMEHFRQAEGLDTRAASRRAYRMLRGAEINS